MTTSPGTAAAATTSPTSPRGVPRSPWAAASSVAPTSQYAATNGSSFTRKPSQKVQLDGLERAGIGGRTAT